MPIPFILAVGAGAAGLLAAIRGGKKMKDANDTMKLADQRPKANIARFETANQTVLQSMDELGKMELEILDSFQKFSDTLERIQNRPEFSEYKKDDITLPAYNSEELKKVSIGAGALLGGLGAAAAKASVAAIGGGAIAASSGGIALILGAVAPGVGLLVGGIVSNLTGGKLSDKADEAWEQMKNAEGEINKICDYLSRLKKAESKFADTLSHVDRIYRRHLEKLQDLVVITGKTDWTEYTDAEKRLTENTVLLVGLLYSMCKVQLVRQTESEEEPNEVNTEEIDSAIENVKEILNDRGLATIL